MHIIFPDPDIFTNYLLMQEKAMAKQEILAHVAATKVGIEGGIGRSRYNMLDASRS